MSAMHIPIDDPIRSVHLVRRIDGEPYRVYRAWSSPEALSEWLPDHVEGSLAPGTRSTLVFPDQRVWWDVLEAEPPTTFRFRRPWLDDESWITTATISIAPRGYSSTVTLDDGPFDLSRPGVLDAYTACLAGWSESLANLRSVIDYSTDLRRYR